MSGIRLEYVTLGAGLLLWMSLMLCTQPWTCGGGRLKKSENVCGGAHTRYRPALNVTVPPALPLTLRSLFSSTCSMRPTMSVLLPVPASLLRLRSCSVSTVGSDCREAASSRTCMQVGGGTGVRGGHGCASHPCLHECQKGGEGSWAGTAGSPIMLDHQSKCRLF